jgi:hypothetical protein
MKLFTRSIKKLFCLAAIFSLLAAAFPFALNAQTATQITPDDNIQKTKSDGKPRGDKQFNLEKDFRVEKIPVAGGAEIITIFANLKGTPALPQDETEEMPLISVLRDTLGDETIENDRLRQVWMLTYAKPSFMQKFTSAVPFLYTRTTNKGKVGNALPPAVIDLHPVKGGGWNTVFWFVFKNLLLSEAGIPVKAATMQYRNNAANYRKSAIARALAVFALYESIEGEKILTDTEIKDIQARMMVSDKMLGGFMQSENLDRVYQKNVAVMRDLRGHNWELLRQYAEAQGLYFEPLVMPDGSATHAIVWVAESDLIANKGKKFDSRFLNIKNPWKDSRLLKWKGYSETRWYDEENRPFAPDTPNAKPKTLIPLAVYGLDYPKIPTLLVDFRSKENPKRREASKRALDDFTRNVLSISKFKSLPYFVGRSVYDFATGRRGMDINQMSRLRSYSQLKLLLSLDASLDADFRNVLAKRLEAVSINPLENDLDVEIKVARQQYANLLAYAKRPDGLPARIEKERRDEMTRIKHSGKQMMLYDLGRFLSFGLYTHREKETPELRAAMNLRRQLDYHERYLLEVARVSARPEIDSDINAVRRSLNFISQNGNEARAKTARAIAKIFSITEDEQARDLALNSLYRINNQAAKKELLAVYENQKVEARWRNLSARYLKQAVKEEQRISANDAKMVTGISGN